MIKVAVLWSGLSGYLSASLQELARQGCDIFVSAYKESSNAPFDDVNFNWIPKSKYLLWSEGKVVYKNLKAALDEFEPDIILCSGWLNKSYLKIARSFKGRSSRVICFDTAWCGNMRQQLGSYWFRFHLAEHFEKAFVPGERQFQTALNIGFEPHQIVLGLYAPDTCRFKGKVSSVNINLNKNFLYVGRLTREKGIECLAAAYTKYRISSKHPWSLTVAGVGPLAPKLMNITGVNMLGFVQPDNLPGIFSASSCMVVPSLYEPWGVQLSEGAIAGLPIIATTECGAAVHLIRPNFNGYLIQAGDVLMLAKAMNLLN